MPLLEDYTAVFIVRIRCESNGAGAPVGEWRGTIVHVPSGKEAAFRDFGAIGKFMRPHLEQLGIDWPSRFWDLVADDEDFEPGPPPK
jgi:hypothetical protein